MRHRGCWRCRKSSSLCIAGSITEGRPVPGVASTPGKQVAQGNFRLYTPRKIIVFLYAESSDQRRENGFTGLCLPGKYRYFLPHLWRVLHLYNCP